MGEPTFYQTWKSLKQMCPLSVDGSLGGTKALWIHG